MLALNTNNSINQSNFTLRNKLKLRNSACMATVYFIVMAMSTMMSRTHTLK